MPLPARAPMRCSRASTPRSSVASSWAAGCSAPSITSATASVTCSGTRATASNSRMPIAAAGSWLRSRWSPRSCRGSSASGWSREARMDDRRTPLARVRGLGSAKDGVGHWWAQRLTAIALIPLVVWFAISLIMLSGADYTVVRAWIGSPLVMMLLILTIGVGLHHGQLGMQVVIEDYVGNDGWKLALIVIVKFIAVLFGLGAIVAILRIGFGG